MALFKCKMCGGDIELAADKTFGTCEYCGSSMTFPKVDDDQRAAAFNRGNHFRRIGEFDKALSVYERIVREDDTDAEAHWCCALCRFGIEYVEDPDTFEYIPTCHRASFDSFLEDVDYRAALKYSDGVTRRQYQKDGAKIAEVQRGILATSQSAQAYDVFICYKESDENGNRTRDSLMAQEIYYQLTEQGRKVFFSRITLEDVVGTQYEPYIFAALNSAKVMIVVGTKPEYLNAVWVRNEWSRFLAMMKKDRHKLLLPCYRDMDPYDMPEQLSVLQSYDMGKIGFIQDLSRGIAKVLDAEKNPVPVKETVIMQAAANTNTAPLLKRAFMFLEDGEWERADEFCEQVLNLDPECARAYLGKLMAELRVRTQEELKNCEKPFDHNNHYRKVIRFADDALRGTMAGYIHHINERNELARLESLYQEARSELKKANSEAQYKAAAKRFAAIKEYKDSAALEKQCLARAESCRKDALYAAAKNMMVGSSIQNYQEAMQRFEALGDWRDSAQQIEICRQKIAEIEEQKARKAQKTQKPPREPKAPKPAKEQSVYYNRKKSKLPLVITAVVCVALLLAIALPAVVMPMIRYNEAIALMDAGNYEEAIAAFEALNGHKDSLTKIAECETAILDGRYDDAIRLMDAGNYEEAIAAFEALDGYKDSTEKAAVSLLKHREEELSKADVGDYVAFGSYEQDNDRSNGKEEIEWLALDKQDDKLLVISKFALDCKPYNPGFTETTWETCSLRSWLNADFLNGAFTVEERTRIPTVTVEAHKNPEYSTNPGNATRDQVFLLSIQEADIYFTSDSAMQCQPTAYAVTCGAWESSSGSCCWWIRSPGSDRFSAAFVDTRAGIYEAGDYAYGSTKAVRPALWIDLNA